MHRGHLAAARAARAALGVDAVHLVLSARPPHRRAAAASPWDRLAMLEIAVDGEPGLVVDDREARRIRPSYTVDTLAELRAEHGTGTPLIWLLGMDAYLGLSTWHRWREVLDLCHLGVLSRAGIAAEAAEMPCAVPEHDLTRLRAAPAGSVVHIPGTAPGVSATDVRRRIAAGADCRDLLPDGVWTYIRQHGLYQESARA